MKENNHAGNPIRCTISFHVLPNHAFYFCFWHLPHAILRPHWGRAGISFLKLHGDIFLHLSRFYSPPNHPTRRYPNPNSWSVSIANRRPSPPPPPPFPPRLLAQSPPRRTSSGAPAAVASSLPTHSPYLPLASSPTFLPPSPVWAKRKP